VFTYTIQDSFGFTDTATVTVTINPINDDPVANPDSDITPYETGITTNVVVNDTDIDGDVPLTITACTTATDGTVVLV
jgi:hypothetical protein